jgi:putative restriction endonuclease
MGVGKRWTEDDLIIAMNLYCKLPFGQLDHRTPIIKEVADKMGRTASSLSMKLCNFASLDPIQKARGIKGLSGTTKADLVIWNEFHKHWEKMGVESEEKFQDLMGVGFSQEEFILSNQKKKIHKAPKQIKNKPKGPTEIEVTRKARIGQEFFRQTVLSSYGYRCCISGNPIPELLIASHILPWSDFPDERLNPQNGLCLSHIHDAAFDKGLITFDNDYKLVISKYLEDFFPYETIKNNFQSYRQKPLHFPDKFKPDMKFIQNHRKEIFIGE